MELPGHRLLASGPAGRGVPRRHAALRGLPAAHGALGRRRRLRAPQPGIGSGEKRRCPCFGSSSFFPFFFSSFPGSFRVFREGVDVGWLVLFCVLFFRPQKGVPSKRHPNELCPKRMWSNWVCPVHRFCFCGKCRAIGPSWKWCFCLFFCRFAFKTTNRGGLVFVGSVELVPTQSNLG